jgi:glycosyltransferase involved in cell wall biosynthesis
MTLPIQQKSANKYFTIGIDARMLGSAQGGLGRYVEELIRNLEKLPTDFQFVIFLRKNNWELYQPQNPNFRKVLADIPWYSWSEQTKLPQILHQEKVDLMHFPHWNVPILYHAPFIVTIHDLLLLHFPTREASTLGPLSYFFKQFVFKRVLHHAVFRSRHIITVSEFSKNDIVKTLHVPDKKISVTYPAPLPLNNQTNNDQNFPQSLNITKPYALYVGVAYPHKNLVRLLEAWKLFTEKNGAKYQLVLVGKKNFFYNRLLKQFTALFTSQSVVFTDYIADNVLPTIYKQAKLFIFPSLYEGFGLPPLEAMQVGVPVISSNSTCLPEILGDAALYFDGTDTTAMSQTLEQGLADENLRKKLITLGHKKYPQYSWKKLAKTTSEIYQNSVY